MAVSLLTLSACDSNESLSAGPNNQGKTPIELTVGIVGENPSDIHAQTRTVITTDSPYGTEATAFGSNTNLYMILKGEHATDNTKAAKYSRTIGSVSSGSGAVSFDDGYQRYWEDDYSRESKISVYSACVPGNTTTALNIGSSTTYSPSSYDWSTTAITPTIAWPLNSGSSASQDATFLTAQDLCFSNNVSDYSSTDNRMVFNSTTKKFEARQMIFHHALTKVTFKIAKGDGFASADPFAFTNPTTENIVMKGFNSSGTLDISTGEFSSFGTSDVSLLANTKDATADAAYAYVLTCMMLPGSALTSTATDEVYFTIDNNKYHITKKQLADALGGKKLSDNSTDALATGSVMRPGVHYVFTMTVSKKKIDKLTASVVPWETVTAKEMTPTNARITISLLDNGSHVTGTANFDLFRKASVSESISDTFEDYSWLTGYAPSSAPSSNKAMLVENTTNSGIYTAKEAAGDTHPEWYWPDNKTYYHFRTIMPKTTDSWKVTENSTDGDHITLTGAVAPYTDVCWGAPFKALANPTTDKLIYSLTSGFDNTGTGSPVTHQIYKAIGPTEDPIRMVMFHMMSDVTIQLTTTNDDDAVNLTGATMSLTVSNTGTVRMGDGLVTPSGSVAVNGTVDSDKKWNYGFVPQSLTGVVLTITTADNNRYFVTLANVVAAAASVSNNLIANPYSTDTNGKYIINRWYPNYKYTYTFLLKKSGVEKISATIANWETVTAAQETVVIE